ncbi:hypothetical protein BGZ70_002488 [Mortierella alpina]|uniref:Uncharacterized protein n=1 Tax=Mortierella alpina TaxID=64518 RepID=A0A9P6IUF1_MORAP|nr:hypothetical protein BGZ70_002488 [Mortierella alpina]
MKLAVVPPVYTKEDSLKHHYHEARSHPHVLASEPLSRPVNALQPLGKIRQPESKGLDRISAAMADSPSPPTAADAAEAAAKPRESRSEGALENQFADGQPVRAEESRSSERRTTAPSEMDLSSHVGKRKLGTDSTGQASSKASSKAASEQRNSRGSEIMYAVVKGVPAKPAIPKLVGATGSGTVVIPRARQDHRSHSSSSVITSSSESPSSIPSSRTSSVNRHGRDIRSNSQQTLVSSRMSGTTDNASKRESVQSFLSSTSTLDESIPEDCSGSVFDDRDVQEQTSLLQQSPLSKEPIVMAKDQSTSDKRGPAKHDRRKAMSSQDVGQMNAHQKYAGGTPMGTQKSETSPENSTLDSSDALFQSTAPLISYPALDVYLSSLKPAQFTDIPRPPPAPPKDEVDLIKAGVKKTPAAKKAPKKAPPPDPREGMFPPLDKVPIGVTLDELKANVTKPSGFFDQELQNTLLSAAMDGIMSGESSNIGIGIMKLEIIRDFLQFVGLYLSVSGNSFVNQKWLYATVNIIPALMSLDLSRAFGFGMVFLILFGLVCFIAQYTFKIMTRADPNDDIEGLEVSSWSLRSKKARIETIAIVFLLTTLYLPLAKLSFDALVWSDSMWPIKNPYTNADFPTLQPLGPSGIYRSPDDFCYVTSMKIQDLNFAYVIIPLAIFALAVNTIYFPLAVRRLIMLNLPRIDKYTEQGERRLDLDEEYKRLTNSDNCPYNFLYNGYRREFGTYKVVIMFTKLFAVIIVVFFSKDNCLFRGYERRTIEATRAGLQILFTASLIYRHYRTQPFLYASQNLSEYWSRACTVVTSVIGLFVVLKVGPASANHLGIMLVATYVLMCIIVIWFVIRQTQKFQIMLKQIQRRLDFSLEIYNPRLNYFKHIKRRIWQETWTTTLLVDESFKMPTDKVIAYSQSPHRPPYLLNFSGTVAERHVENLRIVRQIGLRSYSQACQFLTPAMVRKRGLILNEFVGPDMYYAPEFMASNIKTYFGKAYVVPFPFSVVFVYDESSVVVTLVKEHDLDRYIQQNQDPEIQRRRDLRYQLRALDGKFVVRPFIETRGIQRGRESNGTMEMSLVNAPVSYKRGLFTIHRKKMSSWQGHNMNPGFSVTITYSEGELQDPEGSTQLLHETTISHDVIGITRDFQITPSLARLLRDNHALISRGVKKVKKVMKSYQEHYRNEALRKDATLSYDFFINVYDNPTLKQKELGPLLLATEENPRIRHPSEQVSVAVKYLYERMTAVNRTRCHQWWYLFWDDLYRKNHEEIPQLVPKEFSPAFLGSICYRPMSRQKLELFLEKHGCWQKNGRAGFMHVGVLNRMYTFLNELVFEKMTREQRQKQLEMTTVERQRLEQLFLVTKARIHGDGTYKRIPIHAEDEDEYVDVDGDQLEMGLTTGSGVGKKPSTEALALKKKSKKGWFASITPGRRRKPAHPANYSPGYIIPQTWQQKASQLTALLIGGRQDDMIGDSDEEDDLEERVELVQKKRRTSVSSMERRLAKAGASEESLGGNRHGIPDWKRNSDSLANEQKNPLLQHFSPDERSSVANKVQQARPARADSWASESAASEMTVVEGRRKDVSVPMHELRSSAAQLKQSGGAGVVESLEHRRLGQLRQNAIGASGGGYVGGNGSDDPGMASDTMSITSMSSEDYW